MERGVSAEKMKIWREALVQRKGRHGERRWCRENEDMEIGVSAEAMKICEDTLEQRK